MNKKSEFIQWLQARGVHQRYSNRFESFINPYIEHLGFDPFEIMDNSVITEIIAKLKSKEKELKSNASFNTLRGYGTGMPAAIMGKKNLYEYLQQLNFKQKTFDKDYFDLEGLKEYSKVAKTTYESETIAADWFYDTREKLYYLVQLLAERLSVDLKIVYTEKPNGQAGQGKIVFKNYVLAGFAPTEFAIDDELFIKIEFGDLQEAPNMNVNLDMNFRKGDSRFIGMREAVYNDSYESWDIDENFPTNWNDLIELLHPEIEKLYDQYLVYTQPPTSTNNVNMSSSTSLNLLKYKKQIILQGPPGTGKTKLAKELALQLIDPIQQFDVPQTINISEIKSIIQPGTSISSALGDATYLINEILSDKIKSTKTNGTIDETLFDKIIQAYENKRWESDISDNPTRRAAAFAKFIYQNINKENTENNISEHLKIIQFHPAFTYEDFVRGIVAKPNDEGDGIVYEAENKLLGKFAKEALENYIDSKKTTEITSKENWLDDQFEKFKDKIAGDLETGDYKINDKVAIIELSNNAFRYTGVNGSWKSKTIQRMKFSDIKQAYLDDNKDPKDIESNLNLSGLARRHYFWFFKILTDFKTFLNENNTHYSGFNGNKINLQNYVLIIDEINRANLSSVLGELIYALEYRGETVESMYEVDESNKLVLPPNLYIIGTMNTADRSVGHIDYAIRRRFAFVNVEPKDLTETLGADFHFGLFDKISSLFNHETNLSNEFERDDVRLGHSYFIQQYEKDENGNATTTAYDFNLRLEYEIKPILLEYVKDGILIGEKDSKSIKAFINGLTV